LSCSLGFRFAKADAPSAIFQSAVKNKKLPPTWRL
jgi:hypothetical protein